MTLTWPPREFIRLRLPLPARPRGATRTACIDAARCEQPEPTGHLTHCVVVRADMMPGQQLAQAVHAAGESPGPRPVPGTYAVAVAARDEAHLEQVAARLRALGVEHCEVREPLPEGSARPDELCALGLAPVPDWRRSVPGRALSSLPLALREKRM